MKNISDITGKNIPDLMESVISEVYESMPYGKIATIIESFHDIRITDSVIQDYLQAAASRKFSIDPVLFEIRKLNKFDNNLVKEMLEFVLEDKSTIVITYSCHEELKKHLEDFPEAIEYMIESKENFLKVFEVINKNKEK